MRELFTMWKNTRMVMLVALTAAIYAAILIPFKGFVIIPTLTEVRPANVIPVVFSLFFGPAAAWGSAIGNTIGDIFGGTLGPGSFFGFFGNFLLGYIPYTLWGRLGPLSAGGEPDGRTFRKLLEFWIIALLASLACGAFIGWGLEILRILPFTVIANIIALNNFLAAAILGPLLLLALYPRIKAWGLLWTEVMEMEPSPSATARTGALVITVSILASYIVGNWLGFAAGTGFAAQGFAQAGMAGQLSIIYSLAILWVVLLIGMFMAGNRPLEASEEA
ncbi:MAG: QueT transporter family protein [Clostridiales bacterium]|nr:QueT transporter family protein [Clostridiales bacterium]